MKEIIKPIFFILILGFHLGCDTSTSVLPRDADFFIKYFGGSGDQFGKEVLSLSDGFVLLGSTNIENGNSDILVVKTDLQGNEIWSSTFTGDQVDADDIGMAIVELGAGFVVVGNSENINGNTDIIVLHIGATGEELNRVIIGDPSFNDEAADVIITQAGNIMIAGSSTDVSKTVVSGGGTYDFYCPQLQPDFTLVPNWLGRYGFSGEDKAQSVQQNSEGNFVFLGTTNKSEPGESGKEQTNFLAIEVSQNDIAVDQGDSFGTAKREMASNIATTSDGGFLFVGSSTNDANSSNIFLTRVRQDNSLLGNYEILSQSDIKGKSVFESQRGGYIVLGDIATNTGTNIYMARTSNNGAILWERTFGIDGSNTAGSIIQLEDESYVFIGSINLDNQSKMCLIKTNENGDLTPL